MDVAPADRGVGPVKHFFFSLGEQSLLTRIRRRHSIRIRQIVVYDFA